MPLLVTYAAGAGAVVLRGKQLDLLIVMVQAAAAALARAWVEVATV
jgi:hypothetical protein